MSIRKRIVNMSPTPLCSTMTHSTEHYNSPGAHEEAGFTYPLSGALFNAKKLKYPPTTGRAMKLMPG